jgi:hypothetical protein
MKDAFFQIWKVVFGEWHAGFKCEKAESTEGREGAAVENLTH